MFDKMHTYLFHHIGKTMLQLEKLFSTEETSTVSLNHYLQPNGPGLIKANQSKSNQSLDKDIRSILVGKSIKNEPTGNSGSNNYLQASGIGKIGKKPLRTDRFSTNTIEKTGLEEINNFTIFREDVIPDLLAETNKIENSNNTRSVLHPFLHVDILGYKEHALIDTGSEASIIIQDLYDKVARSSNVPLLPVTNTFIQGVTKTKRVRVNLQCLLPIRMGDHVLHHTFLIVPEIQPALIIGADFLTYFKAKINLADSMINFSDDKKDGRNFNVAIVHKPLKLSRSCSIALVTEQGVPRNQSHLAAEETLNNFACLSSNDPPEDNSEELLEKVLNKINNDERFTAEEKDLIGKTLTENIGVFSEEPGLKLIFK